MQISSDSESSNNQEEFRRLYQKQLEKKEAFLRSNGKAGVRASGNVVKVENARRRKSSFEERRNSHSRSRSRSRDRKKHKERSSSGEKQNHNIFYMPEEIRWYIYDKCPHIQLASRCSKMILELPIYKKKQEILNAIIKNQFVLVTGQTGCGKSTQVPRLIYEYLRNIKNENAKIMCVQPRRLAVINLHKILAKQIPEPNLIGYQIGMKSLIDPENRIVFVTNGIFLQRLVHSTQFFNEYPFIILDEVHERDIDTDFILLTIKRVIREHPKVRIVLMSATIDNELFRYYFASDHIDNILTSENFYKKIIMAQQKPKKQHRMVNEEEEEEDDEVEIKSQDEGKIYNNYGFQFMKSKWPCPTINVTQPGKYKRKYYYLDTLSRFLPEGTLNVKWGSIIFSDKYPSTNKELHETVYLIIEEIAKIHKKSQKKCSVLIFMPGLAQIEGLCDTLTQFLRSDRIKRQFEIIQVHSTILNDDISNKLHESEGSKIKIIVSTNIAESSITVLGVKYVIDYCLSKEVRFDVKSRMENLELVWASKASCNQRAGRTGRVCDGVIFRLLEESFYHKLPDYSTPQIQRSSLDKLVLRIKLLHESHQNKIFEDPGQVLGSAIQPPNLKNIDTAIKSLQFSGGLELRDEQFFITDLGRLYIDIPIDITYCKLLIISLLFDTFEDILIIVSILSQSKNAIRKGNIDRNYVKFYDTMDNKGSCDFLSLIKLYDDQEKNDRINLETYWQVFEMKKDITKRLIKKGFNVNIPSRYNNKEVSRKKLQDRDEEYLFRLKLTLLNGFIEHFLKVREPTLDDKQEKRLKFMKRQGIRHKNTVCILGSNILRKPQTQEGQQKLKNHWRSHVERVIKVKHTDFTITHGLSYLHFKTEKDLNKFLFYRYIQENKRSFQDVDTSRVDRDYLQLAEILKCFGEMDHMHVGRPVTFCKEQTVTIDNYSLNRVINYNQGDQQKFLIANNIVKQSSRMVARYTSLLPENIQHLEIIGHLLFYPFIQLVPNKSRTRYEFVQLKKKNKIPLNYNLTDDQIEKANIIRRKLRNYLSLNKDIDENYSDFKELVIEFVFMRRQEVIEQERWQQTYLNQIFEKNQYLKAAYQEILSSRNTNIHQLDQDRKLSERVFMSDIKTSQLTFNYFSDIIIAETSLDWRKKDYNDWKFKKLKEINEIQQKALNHDSYLACGEDSCGLKLAKLKKVGPINQQIYRDLYQIQEDNIIPMDFQEIGNHFCSMLMSNYIDAQYKTFGCTNNHYFGIMFQKEKRIKIMPFSQLIIIYPDGSAEHADFERLDIKYWKRRHQEKVNEKFKMKLATYCFACDELLSSFKDLEYHIKEGRHAKNVKEFKRTLPQQTKAKTVVGQANDGDGY